MVRPDEPVAYGSRCIDLAGASPVRVSAGAPGSRPQPERAEMLTAKRGVKSLFYRREQGSGPQLYVNAAASSDFQPKGDREGRASHFVVKAMDSAGLVPEPELDLLGVRAAARFHRAMRNRRDPPRQPRRAKTERIRRDAESARSREGVRGARSTDEGVQDNAPEGRGPALVTP